LILVTIRDHLRETGEVRLPGIGTFSALDRPKRLRMRNLTDSVRSTDLVTDTQAEEITKKLLAVLKSELAKGSSLILPGMGELAMVKDQRNSKQIVRLQLCPALKSKARGGPSNGARKSSSGQAQSAHRSSKAASQKQRAD
jgi:nucleoid DNA-binding protein